MLAALVIAPIVFGAPYQQKNPNRLHQLYELKKVPIKFKSTTISCWLMDTDSKRQEGMMFVRPGEVGPKQGMLFVFNDSRERGFWNPNVLFDLDLGYMDANGVMVSVKKLISQHRTSVPSGKPAKYVLEMKHGNFKKLGIKVGSKLVLPKGLGGKS